MGNSQQTKREKLSKNEEDDFVPVITMNHSRYEPAQIYWDQDGNLRYGSSTRNREQEVIDILQKDSTDDSDPTKLWVIIPSRWVRLWLTFTLLKKGDPPGKIDTFSLVVKDRKVIGGIRAKKSLQPPGKDSPGHYRRISVKAWTKLVEHYGADDLVIVVKGIPFDDTSRWRYFPDVNSIDESQLPPPILPEVPKEQESLASKLKGAKDLIPGQGNFKLPGIF